MSITEFFTQYGFQLEATLAAIFLGLIVALIVLLYNKHVPGRLIRYLIEHEACGEDSAVTLAQAGISPRSPVMLSLRRSATMRSLLVILPDPEAGTDKKGRVDLTRARIYLPEDKRHKAEISYNNNGTSVITVLFAVIVFLVMMLLVALLTPNLVQMLQNFLDSLKSA